VSANPLSRGISSYQQTRSLSLGSTEEATTYPLPLPNPLVRSLKRLNSLLALFGANPGRLTTTLSCLPSYVRDLREFKSSAPSTTEFPIGKLYPCLSDKSTESGTARGHYFHQDLLVARRVFSNRPTKHVDVASRVDGFVAHVASFRPIEVVDLRPLPSDIANVTFIQADMMAPLPGALVDYCDSLSCLHALEHFGLGRYGDPIAYDGHLIGYHNMTRVLRKSGVLYLSVPIGPQRVEFNAHRVFSVSYLLSLFAPMYDVKQFSYVDDAGDLHEDVALSRSSIDANFGCHFGCGIFELLKL
jgi:hypothetical protein